MAIGWLIAVLSGGCAIISSLFMIFGYLSSNLTYNLSSLRELIVVFIVAGVPFIVGVTIIWIGTSIYNGLRNEDDTTGQCGVSEGDRHSVESLKKDNPYIDEDL